MFTDVGFHLNSGFTKILCSPIFPLLLLSDFLIFALSKTICGQILSTLLVSDSLIINLNNNEPTIQNYNIHAKHFPYSTLPSFRVTPLILDIKSEAFPQERESVDRPGTVDTSQCPVIKVNHFLGVQLVLQCTISVLWQKSLEEEKLHYGKNAAFFGEPYQFNHLNIFWRLVFVFANLFIGLYINSVWYPG